MACSVLGGFVTSSSSKRWVGWDLILGVLDLASIGDLWCDEGWMLLWGRRNRLRLAVVGPPGQWSLVRLAHYSR